MVLGRGKMRPHFTVFSHVVAMRQPNTVTDVEVN